MLNQRIDKFVKNPKKALFILALPILVGMLMQTLYNIVDTAFVGRLGTEAIAALTFAFPIFFIFIAINVGLGAGVSSRISRYLGEKNKKQAENTAMHGILISIILAFIVFVLAILFLEPLLSLFGAQENVLELSLSYMNIVFLAVFFLFLSSIFSNIFTAQGDSKTSMKIQVFALVVNIILDPIFIYVLGYGVKGAAIATFIGFFFGFLLSIYFIKIKSDLRIRLSSFKYSPKLVRQIFFIGLPASLMMLTLSVLVIFINKFMSHFGINYIAAYGISFKLESIINMPIVSLSLAILPLTGMLYGARKYALLKQTTFYAIKIGVYFSLIMGAILFIFPSVLLRIFTSDPVLLKLGSAYLRIAVFSYPFAVITLVSGRTMQGMGSGIPSLIINLTRTLLIAIPLSWFLIFVLNYNYLSVPISLLTGAVTSALIAVLWFRKKINVLENKIS